MSLVYKCDRCGKVDEFKSNILKIELNSNKNITLCEDCEKDFNKFLREKVNND